MSSPTPSGEATIETVWGRLDQARAQELLSFWRRRRVLPEAEARRRLTEVVCLLRSRHEVGNILKGSGVETVEFRAGMVVGAGSTSYQLLKSLTDRLPVMICPRWLSTATQPVAVDDVLAYLLAANDLPPGGSRIFEIGGTDISTYGDLIREYARQKGLRRWLISVPVLTPYLSGLWLALVTPASFEVGRHLIEGLKNPTVVRDEAALDVFPILPIGTSEAIRKALTVAGR